MADLRHVVTALTVTMLLPIVGCVAAEAKGELQYPFHDGDHVIFYADSITDNQPWARSFEHWARARKPGTKLRFTNLAWSGDQAFNEARMERDWVFADNATYVIFFLGMNDGQYKPFAEETLTTYVNSMRKRIQFVQDKGCRVLVMSPIEYEADVFPKAPDGADRTFYPETLRKLSDGARDLAKEMKCDFYDLNADWTKFTHSAKKANPKLNFTFEGIHPNADGQSLIAYLLATHFGETFTPWTGDVAWKDGQQVAELKVPPTSMPTLFHGRDSYAFPKYTNSTITDRWTLRVKDFDSPYAIVSYDNSPVAVVSQKELKEGVTLSEDLLPWIASSQLLESTIERKQGAFYRQWRNIRLSKTPSAYTKAPFEPETVESRLLLNESIFLDQQASIIAPEAPIEIEIKATDQKEPFGASSFKLVHPYPADGEVQINLTVNTALLRNVTIPGHPAPVAVKPPLTIKGLFDAGIASRLASGWMSVPMFDDGTNGDLHANDGIWTFNLNVKKNNTPVQLVVDDQGTDRSTWESTLFATVKPWSLEIKADGNKAIHLGRETLEDLKKKGIITSFGTE